MHRETSVYMHIIMVMPARSYPFLQHWCNVNTLFIFERLDDIVDINPRLCPHITWEDKHQTEIGKRVLITYYFADELLE